VSIAFVPPLPQMHARVDGSRGRRRLQTRTYGRSAASSTRFSQPPRPVTLKGWSPSSIRISCCGPTPER
jgi:hypothetical protein